jgi:hypothetical protein
MLYITLRGYLCHSIVLNVHAPTGDKIHDVKKSFHDELEHVFHKLPKYHMQILFGDFNAKVGRKVIFNRQLGMKVYTKLVMVMELE